MKIQQAIFTSSDRGQIKGYQLVAVSEDIDRGLSRELQLWSPSHLGEDAPANWTINYFPISQDHVAVSRTVLGGPEYSNRGGSQVVTLIAVLHNQQFSAYHNNAMLVAYTALALGWLRIPSDMPSHLDPIELPDIPLPSSRGSHSFSPPQLTTPVEHYPKICDTSRSTTDEQLNVHVLNNLTELVENKQRLGIVGARDPLRMVQCFIERLPIASRRAFSFTTGLQPTYRRPFQAHFIASASPALMQTLKSEGIVLVDV